jgi:hypothetical protein
MYDLAGELLDKNGAIAGKPRLQGDTPNLA